MREESPPKVTEELKGRHESPIEGRRESELKVRDVSPKVNECKLSNIVSIEINPQAVPDLNLNIEVEKNEVALRIENQESSFGVSGVNDDA